MTQREKRRKSEAGRLRFVVDTTEGELALLDALATKNEITRADLVRQLLFDGLSARFGVA